MKNRSRDPFLHLYDLARMTQRTTTTPRCCIGDLPAGTLIDDDPIVGVITGRRDDAGRVAVSTSAAGGGVLFPPQRIVSVLASPSETGLIALAAIHLFNQLH